MYFSYILLGVINYNVAHIFVCTIPHCLFHFIVIINS